MPASEVASRDLVAVDPEDDLSDALTLMAQHQVRRLAVVDKEERLVGVVSQADVAMTAKEKDTGQLVEDISGHHRGRVRPESSRRSGAVSAAEHRRSGASVEPEEPARSDRSTRCRRPFVSKSGCSQTLRGDSATAKELNRSGETRFRRER